MFLAFESIPMLSTRLDTPLLAAFLASLVECIEALTVVLAVGSVRGWPSALAGTGAGLAFLAALVAALGPALTRVPLHLIQFGVGTLILLFGLRWLRKAILRSAGVIALHDEQASFQKSAAAAISVAGSKTSGLRIGAWDKLAFVAAFNITALEGTEVVFIVIALGAGGTGLLLPTSLGAVAALLVVVVLGLILHRPLTRIPENTLKFAVGVLLSAFGTFWVSEGAGLVWPGPAFTNPDIAIPFLVAAWLGLGLWLVPVCFVRAPHAVTVED
jgi:uncharacterized membrane protein